MTNYRNDPRFWRERRLIAGAIVISVLVLVSISYVSYTQLKMQEAEMARLTAEERALALATPAQTSDATVYFQRAEASRKAQRIPEAIADLQRAVELEPDNAIYSNTLGMLQLTHGAAPETLGQFRATPNQKLTELPKGKVFIAILLSLQEERYSDSAIYLEMAATLLPSATFSTLLNAPELLPYQTRPELLRYQSQPH